MKCAKVHLQERFKPKIKPESSALDEKPRRYCQRRLVNPEHEEDPRWMDVYKRFYCNGEIEQVNDTHDSIQATPDPEELFLTVQTLRFQGDVDQTKKLRTNFKYKIPSDGAKHRLFVKEAVIDDYSDDDRSSQLTSYYFDDYIKYLFNNDKSRPTSGKSCIFLQGLSNKRENKATQVDAEQTSEGNKISRKLDAKVKTLFKKCDKQEIKDEIKSDDGDMDDTKITFHKSGKRKSLTISRTQTPETLQVIRVDVVCNHSSSSVLSDYDDKKPQCDTTDINIENINIKGNHFADKYLLTNTIKKLDENLTGGGKVTLLCKTFKLSERAKTVPANKPKTNTRDEKLKSKESKKSTSSKNKSSKAKIRKQIHFV